MTLEESPSVRACSARAPTGPSRNSHRGRSAYPDQAQLLDIVLPCGWYHALSFAATATRVELEPMAPRFDAVVARTTGTRATAFPS
jgi:hypothetical protein